MIIVGRAFIESVSHCDYAIHYCITISHASITNLIFIQPNNMTKKKLKETIRSIKFSNIQPVVFFLSTPAFCETICFVQLLTHYYNMALLFNGIIALIDDLSYVRALWAQTILIQSRIYSSTS